MPKGRTIKPNFRQIALLTPPIVLIGAIASLPFIDLPEIDFRSDAEIQSEQERETIDTRLDIRDRSQTGLLIQDTAQARLRLTKANKDSQQKIETWQKTIENAQGLNLFITPVTEGIQTVYVADGYEISDTAFGQHSSGDFNAIAAHMIEVIETGSDKRTRIYNPEAYGIHLTGAVTFEPSEITTEDFVEQIERLIATEQTKIEERRNLSAELNEEIEGYKQIELRILHFVQQGMSIAEAARLYDLNLSKSDFTEKINTLKNIPETSEPNKTTQPGIIPNP